MNGNGEDIYVEIFSIFLFNVGERIEISDKEGCGFGILVISGFDYG